MVLAGAVAGTVTAAATAVGAAGTLNGNLFLPEPVLCIMVPKTSTWERTFFWKHTTSSCNSKILFLENLIMLFFNIRSINWRLC